MQTPDVIREQGDHWRYGRCQAWRYLSYLILVAAGGDGGLEERQQEQVYDMGTPDRAEEVWLGFVRSSIDHGPCG